MSLTNKVKNLIRLAIITVISDDNKDFPSHQITYQGKVSEGISWYPWGIHANPGKSALALMFAIGGNSENKFFLPGSPKERLDDLLPTPLSEGEVLIYNPLTKTYVHFLENGDIDIDSQKDVNIRVAGNLTADVEGNVIADIEGNVVADIEGNTELDVAGNIDVDSAGTITMTAPDIDFVGDVDIQGKFTTTGDVDLGIGGEVGIGVAFGGSGSRAARKLDEAALQFPTRISEGSEKVEIVGPAS